MATFSTLESDLEKKLLIEQRGAALFFTINKPAARNALDEDVILALDTAIREASNESSVRAIVLTGSGTQAFCAGADLKPDSDIFAYDYATPNIPFADLLRTAEACTLPLVARVNGHCFAGGMGLLAMCDMAVAASSARFSLPEVKIGLFPMQVAAFLKSIIPPRKFAEMCMTGEAITAMEAERYGLVNYVAEPDALDARIDWLLERIVDKSPAAIRNGKYSMMYMSELTRRQALAFAESKIHTMVLTDDAREGRLAFQAKRKPVWGQALSAPADE